MTAAELKQKAFKQSAFPFHYYFTPDEMQAFIDQVCKEQREKCNAEITDEPFYPILIRAIRYFVINAPKPAGL